MNEPTPPSSSGLHANLVAGWLAVTLFLGVGVALEALHFIKAPFYVDARLRRELWTLGHAHGTLLGLVNIAFATSAARFVPERTRRRAGPLILAGALLVPIGFFAGGVANAEGDPSVGIVLVPVGALLLLAGLLPVVVAALRRPPAAG